MPEQVVVLGTEWHRGFLLVKFAEAALTGIMEKFAPGPGGRTMSREEIAAEAWAQAQAMLEAMPK